MIEEGLEGAYTPLRAERKRLGWTTSQLQQKLAEQMEQKPKRQLISREQIGRWERGQSPPEDYWIAKLCAVYGKTAEELGLYRRTVPKRPRKAGATIGTNHVASQRLPASPPDKRYIVGREAEAEHFDAVLTGRTAHRLLNIFGPGGIGKTWVRYLLTRRARAQTIPVGVVDCGSAALSPDQILHALHQNLMAGPHREDLQPCLQQFDDQFNDYQLITRAVLRAGGVEALFDAVGSVRDPAALTAILVGIGEHLSSDAERAVHNRFALDRYLRSAEQSLTTAFLEGIEVAGERTGCRTALVFDTYEQLQDSITESWVCRQFAPLLPPTARLIIFGRNALPRFNFDWHEHDESLDLYPLPELREDAAKSYLHHYGLEEPALLDRVYAITGGYPLLLMLVRQLAMEVGGWDQIDVLDGSADRDTIATQLLDRILREGRVLELRTVLEKGAVAPWLDPGAIAALLEIRHDEARRIYDKLRRHSFVERHPPNGIRFHDKIRELLKHRLEFTDAAEYGQLKSRIEAYYHTRSGAFGRQSQDPPHAGEGAT